jgi:translation initiation factor IF-3
VDQNNTFHHTYNVNDAMNLARSQGMDLVCFNRPTGNELAFCKILDYNKWLYSEEKRKKKELKNSQQKETKEMRFTPNIDINDMGHKMRQVNEFLDAGDDVTLTMKLRGREKAHMPEAEAKMNEILRLSKEHGKEVFRKKHDNLIVVRLSKITKEKEN